MQEQVNQRHAGRDLAKRKRAERQREDDAIWNAARPRFEAVTDALRLPRSVVDDIFAHTEARAGRTLALIEFAMRYRQSLDWMFWGDLSAYFAHGVSWAAQAD